MVGDVGAGGLDLDQPGLAFCDAERLAVGAVQLQRVQRAGESVRRRAQPGKIGRGEDRAELAAVSDEFVAGAGGLAVGGPALEGQPRLQLGH